MATETKHTPGPWTMESHPSDDSPEWSWIVVGPPPHDILGICDLNHYSKTDEEMDANGRLIAAAPELLAALKEISDRDPLGETCNQECVCIGCIARKVISKAEGK